MMIYANACPDYYDKKYSSVQYGALLTQLTGKGPKQRICVRDNGLGLISKTQAVWERIKGFFGFKNSVHPERVKAEWIKFLHYGLLKGYFDNQINMAALARIEPTSPIVDQNLTQTQKINSLRASLTSFCKLNAKKLAPSFWNRHKALRVGLFPTNFGETYLSLSGQTRTLHNLTKAASLKFSMEDSYSQRLDRATAIFHNNIAAPKFFMRMAKRAYIRHEHQLTLDYLDRVSNQPSHLRFICSVSIGKYNTQIPSAAVPPELKMDFAAALMDAANSHAKNAKSTSATLLKTVTFGYVDRPKASNFKAWQYYKHAILIGDTEQKNTIVKRMWELGCGDSFELACKFFEQKDWLVAANFFLVHMKSFKKLSSTVEGAELRNKFAVSIANYLEKNVNEECLDLINQAIDAHGELDENDLEGLTFNGRFLVDQESSLYFLKGKIMEKLGKYTKAEIFQAYEKAARLAPENAWGAAGYFADDDQMSSQDNIDDQINNYKALAIEWGALRQLPKPLFDSLK